MSTLIFTRDGILFPAQVTGAPDNIRLRFPVYHLPTRNNASREAHVAGHGRQAAHRSTLGLPLVTWPWLPANRRQRSVVAGFSGQRPSTSTLTSLTTRASATTG